MGIAKLQTFLRRHRKIALDTSIFIYQLEAHPKYVPSTQHVFSWLEAAGNKAVTSTITMTELMVHPYRHGADRKVIEFYALLSTFPNLDWIAPTLQIADRAAQLRAVYGLRTPDALQAATALDAHSSGFLTNDAVFERVSGFQSLVLDRVC